LTKRKHVHNVDLTYSKYRVLKKSPQNYIQMLPKQAGQLNNSITTTKLESVTA